MTIFAPMDLPPEDLSRLSLELAATFRRHGMLAEAQLLEIEHWDRQSVLGWLRALEPPAEPPPPPAWH